jgi:hypothetical protein
MPVFCKPKKRVKRYNWYVEVVVENADIAGVFENDDKEVQLSDLGHAH